MRTQNPPPLKACRFDSDLGHHMNIRFIRADRALHTAARYTRRTFTAQHAECASKNTYTLLTHKSAADDPQGPLVARLPHGISEEGVDHLGSIAGPPIRACARAAS
jgi:hypothetical protein